jgi:hypothetical protein
MSFKSIILAFLISGITLIGCNEKPLVTKFNVTQDELNEPDTAYCDFENFVTLEDSEFGKIRNMALSSDRTRFYLYFDDGYEKVIFYYLSSNGVNDIEQDTVMSIGEDNDLLSVYFEFDRYGNSKQTARSGKVYFDRLPSGKLKITWCNLGIPKVVGHTLKSQGSFTY